MNTFLMIIDTLKAELGKCCLLTKSLAKDLVLLRNRILYENSDRWHFFPWEKGRKYLLLIFKDDELPVWNTFSHLKSRITIFSIGSKIPLVLCKWLREKEVQTLYPNTGIFITNIYHASDEFLELKIFFISKKNQNSFMIYNATCLHALFFITLNQI